ncbi:o-succinylbenzoate--CoA ligase [Ktedonosporobacter rubrisoli]|uniref:2-succinylbenzoate--CoA ligase n=1 Tax=Ktedonosporobacter rubrisoli TaxID=2509675 RepID=A0A4P6K6C6_KTERU|nr:o-succinylbenzoate--CoA ligase [Ktedonosporobacter rubrisoli]
MTDRTETLLPNWLRRCAENRPDHLAVSCGSVRLSFAELDFQASRLARQLASIGVQEGSRVALLAANGLEFVACVHALTSLGAILVPLNIRLSREELRWQLSDIQAAFLLSDQRYAEVAAALHMALPGIQPGLLLSEAGEVRLQDAASLDVPLRTLIDLTATQAIIYTSGTTGQPKGVIITYGMQWWNALGSALNLGHRPDDCWLACMPLFHIGGLSILMRSVIYTISISLHERFDAVAVNRAIQEDNVSIISVVAVMLQRMLSALDASQNEQGYPATLRCVLLGGGPAPRPLLEDCARRGIPVVQTYGLTESCSQAVTLAPADALRKLGSAGRPLLPVQIRIMQDGRIAAANEAGVIYLKGPSITPGYANRPEATAKVMHEDWLSTGDMGYLDEDGYLYVLDRRTDLIISGGENVYPAEVESVLLAHPAVEEAGVCGREDSQWGQIPIAFVRPRHGCKLHVEELQVHAAQHLARYKQPRAIYLVEELPRNSSGKLLRRELPHLLKQLTLAQQGKS